MAIAANSSKSPTKTPKGSKKEVKQEDSQSKQSPPTSKKRTAEGTPKQEKAQTEHTALENALFETLANSARAMDTQLKAIKKIFYDNDRDLLLTKKSLKPQKDPEAPKRPASAYLLFQNDMRLKKDPSQSQTEFMSQVGKEWNSIKPEEKDKYNKLYLKSIENYEKERDEYVKSGKDAAWHKKGEDEGFSTYPAAKKPNNATAEKVEKTEKKPKEKKVEKKDDKKAEKKEVKEEPKPSKATASKKDEKKEAAPTSKSSKSKKEEKKPEPVEESEESSESDSDESESESGSGSEESDSDESESESEPEPPKKAAKKVRRSLNV